MVAVLVLLPAPPDNNSGGFTTVNRRVPALRDTVDPLAKTPPPAEQEPAPVSLPSIARQHQNVVTPEPAPAPIPLRKPEFEIPSVPPAPQSEPQKQKLSRLPGEPTPEAESGRSAGLPSKSEIREWVKSQAWEFLGGVDAQGNILYRFEVWLDAPPELIGAIKSVSYEYDAPSATPKSRVSENSKGGFRARFGALACAKGITITVTMVDGRSRRAEADGCRALN